MNIIQSIAKEIRTKFLPSNYTPVGNNVEGHLEGIDNALVPVDISGKQDKDLTAVSGNAAEFDANGQTVDAGFTFGSAASADTSDFDAAGTAAAAQAAAIQRANHTGTQLAATISDFAAAVRLVPEYTYTIEDRFTADLPAGSVDGTAATPGPGTRDVVDTGGANVLIENSRALVIGANTNDAHILRYTNAVTRLAGRVIAYTLRMQTLGTMYMGPCIAATCLVADTNNTGVLVVSPSFVARKTQTSDSPVLFTAEADVEYRVYVVLRGTGSFILIKSGGVTRLYHFNEWVSTSPLYLGFNARGVGPNEISNIAVSDGQFYAVEPIVSDSFNRADGALGYSDGSAHAEGDAGGGKAWAQTLGTWAIATNAAVSSATSGGRAYATVAAETIDVYIRAKITVAGGQAGFVLRYVDGNNYMYAYHDGTNAALYKAVGGVGTAVVSPTAATYAAGAFLEVVADGTSFSLYYNQMRVGTGTAADAVLQTSKRCGLFTTNTGNTFDDFLVFKHKDYSDLGVF